jgi:hypothetical protein
MGLGIHFRRHADCPATATKVFYRSQSLIFVFASANKLLPPAMKPKILPLLVLLAAIPLTNKLANAHEFIITIVGHDVMYNGSRKAAAPVVVCPKSGIHEINGYSLDQVSQHCFFVEIQNRQKVPDVIRMSASAWFDSLKFEITDRSGKIYTTEHVSSEWAANPMVTWTFASGDMRDIPIDFTNGAMAGWQGLPPPPSAPETDTMTATFTYYDTATGKTISVRSKPIDVILTSGN